MKYQNDVLFFDSIFECGNLLQAEMVSQSEYQLYMQVDTNTRGHQQWFYFRVRNTRADRKYTFRIMNFTKQGLTPYGHQNNNVNNANQGNLGSGQSAQPGLGNPGGGGIMGNKKSDHLQKIHFKSKLSEDTEWRVIDSDQLEFVKTSVQRKRKDILAAAADSDQEEMNEGDMELLEQQQLNSQKQFLKQKSPKKRKPLYYYALQFEVQFSHNNDSVYFAYALPYSLTDMTEMILNKEAQMQASAQGQDDEIKSQPEEGGESSKENEEKPPSRQQQPSQVHIPPQQQATQGGTPIWQENGVTIEVENKSLYYKREILARSICGLPLYVITISRDSKTFRKKPVVIFTSRVHAAETPGSFVFDGIYKFLCSNTSEAKFLRKFYTFVLVPTLNPDGVVCGNYRSSISGVDLNRQWISPDEEFHPEIYSIKSLMKTFCEKERRQLWIYCDLHGHSKKKNSFFYGCNTAANGGFLSWTIVRLLPRIFAKKTHLFNYKDCRFKVEPYKLGTGRVVAWKQFSITHSFTLESSFYGYDFGEDEHKLFTQKEYSEVGQKLCQSIYELHFLWKSIRNELKLTNGWLKPRTLIEKTGVPAAQLLNEELQKKKKEDMKKKAIEQYEQFLKKFYNKGDAPLLSQGSGANTGGNQIRRASKLITIQNAQKGDQMVGGAPLVQTDQGMRSKQPTKTSLQQTRYPVNHQQQQHQQNVGQPEENSTAKSRNRDLAGGNSQNFSTAQKGQIVSQQQVNSEEDQLYLLLLGLVKIQALIRGFLARKRFQTMYPKIRIVQKRLPKPQGEDLSESRPLAQTDLLGIRQVSIKDKMQISQGLQPPNFSLGNENTGLNDWRQYFRDQELEKAYHHVEVEREENPEDDEDLISDGGGSSSNPSQDNFDLQEIYEQIYQVNNGQEAALRKEEANTRFFQEINEQDFIDQQAMFQLLDGAFKGKRVQPVRQSVNMVRGKAIKSGKYFKNESGQKGQFSNIQASPDKAMLRKQSFEQQQKDHNMNSLKKPDNTSPMQQQQHIHRGLDDHDAHPLTTHQIIDPNKADRHMSSQTRIQTGNSLKNGAGGSANQTQSALNNQNGVSANGISHMHFKLFHQNTTSGGLMGSNHYGKKESIQQVIKDCFITKKIGNVQQTQTGFFANGAYDGGGHRVHSHNSLKNQMQGQVQNTIQYIKRQQQQQRKGSQYQHKTPAQKLQEQRDQIKQYFNQQGFPIAIVPGSSNAQYRALITGQNILQEQSIPMHNIHQVAIDGYPQPMSLAYNLKAPNGLDQNNIHSITYYGGFGQSYGLAVPQMQAPSQAIPTTQDAATSSLFMKYVKSKLVKKIKTDQIPQQIADKYIDIYKELIDKEAQRKIEEQEFLRMHNNQNYSLAALGKSGNFSSSHNMGTGTLHHGSQSNNSRNKNGTKSESKSRASNAQQKSKQALGSINSAKQQHQYHQNTSRRNTGAPGEQQTTSFLLNNNNTQSFKVGEESFVYMMPGIQDNQHQQQMMKNGSDGALVRLSMDGFGNQPNFEIYNPNHLQDGPQHPPSEVQLNDNLQVHYNLFHPPAPISSSDGIQNQQQQATKFPLINNFAQTVDYKKRSRENIGLQNDPSRVPQQQQLTSFPVGAPNSSNQPNVQNNNLLFVYHPPGAVTGAHEFPHQDGVILMDQVSEASSPIRSKSKKRDRQMKQGGGGAGGARLGGQGQAQSEESIDSSIDEEMLDKIKNIYSEMRKHTHSTQYYGAVNNQNSYYHYQNQAAQQQNSGAGLSKVAVVGGMRQKRLLIKGQNQQQQQMGYSQGIPQQLNQTTTNFTNHAQQQPVPSNTIESAKNGSSYQPTGGSGMGVTYPYQAEQAYYQNKQSSKSQSGRRH